MNTCPYVCNNKTEFGYCCSTVCINPKYNQQTVTAWLSKADYVQVVRCKDCRFYRFYDSTFGKGWMCFENNTARHRDDYCSRGERKDDAKE